MNFALRLLRVLGTTLFSFVARILCGKYILFTQVFSWKLLFHELFHESCRNTVFLKESLFPKNMNFRVSCIWILITDTWKLRTFRKKMTSNLRAVFNNSVFPFDFPNFSLMLEVVQVPVAVAAPPPPQCLDNSPKLIFAAAVGGGWWLHHCLLPSVNTAAGGPAPPPNPSFSLHSVCL